MCNVVSEKFTHIYRWDRQGRKGQPCRLLARGKMNSICVEFSDGYTMITSGNAIRRLNEVLDRVYSHPSSPDFQKAASEAIRRA